MERSRDWKGSERTTPPLTRTSSSARCRRGLRRRLRHLDGAPQRQFGRLRHRRRASCNHGRHQPLGMDGGFDLSTTGNSDDWPAGCNHGVALPQLRRGRQRRYHQHLSLLRCSGHQRKVRLVVNAYRSGLKNGKPTIAQWSVFLPHWGQSRRQAGSPILSPPRRRLSTEFEVGHHESEVDSGAIKL
jgi:hypothetical protein